MKSMILSLGVALCLAAGSLSAKEEPKPVQQHNSNAVWFENWTGLSNSLMKISMPTGELTDVFAATGTPVFKLEGNEVADGVYRYELSAATEEVVKLVNQIDNGRGDKANGNHAKSFHMSGYFTVSRGVIVTPKDAEEE